MQWLTPKFVFFFLIKILIMDKPKTVVAESYDGFPLFGCKLFTISGKINMTVSVGFYISTINHK